MQTRASKTAQQRDSSLLCVCHFRDLTIQRDIQRQSHADQLERLLGQYEDICMTCAWNMKTCMEYEDMCMEYEDMCMKYEDMHMKYEDICMEYADKG